MKEDLMRKFYGFFKHGCSYRSNSKIKLKYS